MITILRVRTLHATLTFTSLSLITSVVNVELTTDGLFLTLGKIMPPLRDNGFVAFALALIGIAFDAIMPGGNRLPPAFDGVVLVEGSVDGSADDEAANVVVGSGGSVNSSINEYLKWTSSFGKFNFTFNRVAWLELTCLNRIRRVDRSWDPIVIRRVQVAARAQQRHLPVSSAASPPCPNC